MGRKRYNKKLRTRQALWNWTKSYGLCEPTIFCYSGYTSASAAQCD